MGLFKDLFGKLTGGGKTTVTGALGALIKGGGANGLNDLVDHLNAGGLKEQVDSWISTGINKAVTSQQVTDAMGSKLGQVAAKLGVSPEAAAAQLTTALPSVIDRLTPNGHVPSGAALRRSLHKL